MRLVVALAFLLPLVVPADARASQGHHRRATSPSRLGSSTGSDTSESPRVLDGRFGKVPIPNLPPTSVALGTNICLSVRDATSITVNNVVVKLKASTCICIDGTLYLRTTFSGVVPSTSLQLDGRIQSATQADGLVSLSDSVAATDITRAGALSLDVGICTQLAVTVNDPFSVHDFTDIRNAGCCRRKCKDGYTSCGGTCISKTEYTCVSGVPKPNLAKRDLGCPASMTMCPVGLTGWECIDTKTDIESCGGCLHAGATKNTAALGSDCTTLPNVGEVACEHGQCQVKTCQRGFALSANGTACEIRSARTGWVSGKQGSSWSGFSVQNRGL